jgi:hypothetical protein
MIRRLLLVCLTWVCVVGICSAQDSRRFEVSGGYSYLNLDTGPGSPRINVSGWQAGLSVNATRLLAAEAQFSDYYPRYDFATSLNLNIPATRYTEYLFFLDPGSTGITSSCMPLPGEFMRPGSMLRTMQKVARRKPPAGASRSVSFGT